MTRGATAGLLTGSVSSHAGSPAVCDNSRVTDGPPPKKVSREDREIDYLMCSPVRHSLLRLRDGRQQTITEALCLVCGNDEVRMFNIGEEAGPDDDDDDRGVRQPSHRALCLGRDVPDLLPPLQVRDLAPALALARRGGAPPRPLRSPTRRSRRCARSLSDIDFDAAARRGGADAARRHGARARLRRRRARREGNHPLGRDLRLRHRQRAT